jgi:ABC-type dipeptide/oligopeptide/nickel transport system ATPase component
VKDLRTPSMARSGPAGSGRCGSPALRASTALLTVVVMYRGRVMEAGSREEIFRHPGHPYLKALMRAVRVFPLNQPERRVKDLRTPSMARSGPAGSGRCGSPVPTSRP